MNNTERIAEIRERCETATPGPWEITEEPKGFVDVTYQGKYRVAVVGYRSDAALLAHAREDIPYLLTLNAEKDKEIDRLTADRDKWQRLAEWRYEYIRSLGSKAEEGWSEAEYLNHLLEQSTEHINKLTAELEQKTKDVVQLAIESVEREKQLARLEAEVQHWADAEAAGRLVVLPPKSRYGSGTLDDAIRKAIYTCSVTNNEITRLTLDALIEKQIREEAEAELSAEGVE